MSNFTAETEMFNLDESGYVDTLTVDAERNGQPTGWKIVLAGPSNPAALQSQEEYLRRDVREEQDRQEAALAAVKAGKNPPMKITTVEELRRRRAELVSSRVLSSDPFKYNGSTRSLNPTLALEILSNPKFEWLLDFLDAKLSNKLNFFQN